VVVGAVVGLVVMFDLWRFYLYDLCLVGFMMYVLVYFEVFVEEVWCGLVSLWIVVMYFLEEIHVVYEVLVEWLYVGKIVVFLF